MKKVKSFTLSENVVNILEGISKQSKPHSFQSAVVEEAIYDYAVKINYKENENETSSKEKSRSKKETSS